MKKLFLQLSLAGFCLSSSLITNAQPDIQIQWQKTLGGDSQDNMACVAQALDGGYVFGGFSLSAKTGDKTDTNRGPTLTSDYWLIKTNSSGAIEWQKTMGGNNGDYLTHVSSTRDSGFLVVGYSNSSVSGEKSEYSFGTNDYWVLKLSKNGTIEWDKTYGGLGSENAVKGFQTRDGNYIVAGYSQSDISGNKTVPNRGGNIPTAGYDYWILKLNPSGTILWQKAYGGDRSDQFSDIVETFDGGFLLGGCSSSGISGEKTAPIIGSNAGSNDIWLVKTDSAGNVQWDKTLGGNDGEAYTSVSQTRDSGYVLAIQSFSGRSGDKTDTNRGGQYTSDYWIVKTDSKANIQWQKTYGTTGYDWASTAFQTQDGGYFVHGHAPSTKTGEKTDAGYGGSDYWTLKLDDTGAIEWQKAWGGSGEETIFGYPDLAIQTADKGFVIGGYSGSGKSGLKTDTSRNTGPLAPYFQDFWVVKIGEVCHQTDTTFLTGEVCTVGGYTLPWDSTAYEGGIYAYNYERSMFGSHCDSTVVVELTPIDLDPVISVDEFELSTAKPYTTYQWMLNGTAIQGATNPKYIVSENGDYTVAVTNETGCPDTSAIYKVTNVAIGSVNFEGQIRIYPNPAHGQVYIQAHIPVHATLSSVEGKVILQQNNATTISLQGLAQGIYFLQIRNKNYQIVKIEKLIIE
jgi:hypothetical protein